MGLPSSAIGYTMQRSARYARRPARWLMTQSDAVVHACRHHRTKRVAHAGMYDRELPPMPPPTGDVGDACDESLGDAAGVSGRLFRIHR